jgi:hypothetical protein
MLRSRIKSAEPSGFASLSIVGGTPSLPGGPVYSYFLTATLAFPEVVRLQDQLFKAKGETSTIANMWILPFVGYIGVCIGFAFLTLAIGMYLLRFPVCS